MFDQLGGQQPVRDLPGSSEALGEGQEVVLFVRPALSTIQWVGRVWFRTGHSSTVGGSPDNVLS